MAKISDEDRQYVIDVWTEMLVGQGADEDEAEDIATKITDQAIAQHES